MCYPFMRYFDKEGSMRNKEKHQKTHVIGAFLAVLAIMFIAVGALVTPQAKAQDGNRIDPKNYTLDIQITDKDGNPFTGNIDASESSDVVDQEIGLRIEGSFPDDAKKGDYIEFESSVPVGLLQKSLTLRNTDPNSPQSLATLDVQERETPEGPKQTFRITLLEHAEKYSNREFSVKIAINSFNVPCGEEDVLTRPIKFYVRDNNTGNDWFLDTEISVSGKQCSSNTDPSPYERGWFPGDPIAEAKCAAPGSIYTDLTIQKEMILPNGDKIVNYIEPVQNIEMYIGAGQFDTMGSLNFEYNANSKFDPEKQNKQYFYKTKEQVQNEIRTGEAFDIHTIPVRFSEFEPVEGGLDPGVVGKLYNVMAGKSIVTDLTGGVAVVPNNFLFPTKEIATQFKSFIVQTYGEDAWDNTNNGFAKLSNQDTQKIVEKAVELWNRFLAENMEIVEFLPDEGMIKMTLHEASGVVNLVTADEDKPLRGGNAKVFRGLTGLLFSFDSDLFGAYALYNGANSYPAPHFKYVSTSKLHSGECTGSVERKIGSLDGVASGERIPAATGSVRWSKDFVNVEGGKEIVSVDAVFEDIKWELRSIDRPHATPIGVRDVTKYGWTRHSDIDTFNDADTRTGEYLVENLIPGEYELVEVDAPAGIKVLNDPIRFTVPRDDTTPVDLGTITDELDPISYSWEKVNAYGEHIPGTRWVITNDNDQYMREADERRSWEVEDCVDENCASSDQSRQFADIDPRPGYIKILAPPYQAYGVDEVFVPEPYVPNSDFFIYASYEGKEYVHDTPLVNYPEHQVCFVKVDAKTGDPVKTSGAVFDYSWYSSYGTNGQGEGKFESDADGSLGCVNYPDKNDDLNLYITEIQAPEGYKKIENEFHIRYSGYSETVNPRISIFDNEAPINIPIKVEKETGEFGQDIHTVYIPNDPEEPFPVAFTLPATGDKPMLILSLLGGTAVLLVALRLGQKIASGSRRRF